jgi:hypothetical protein
MLPSRICQRAKRLPSCSLDLVSALRLYHWSPLSPGAVVSTKPLLGCLASRSEHREGERVLFGIHVLVSSKCRMMNVRATCQNYW